MLTEQQIRLYARQVILRELGHAGQARLCASRVAIADRDAALQPAAADVAREYLQRAGLQVGTSGEPVVLSEVSVTEPELQACADWLVGAWAAVETIKRVAGVGSEATELPAFWTAEVD